MNEQELAHKVRCLQLALEESQRALEEARKDSAGKTVTINDLEKTVKVMHNKYMVRQRQGGQGAMGGEEQTG